MGIRTKKRRPFNECTSLDLPIGENESDGMTIADTVPDLSAEQAIEDAEQRAYIEKLHVDLDLCLSMIPEECAEVVRAGIMRAAHWTILPLKEEMPGNGYGN